jgi:hypothetical protein
MTRTTAGFILAGFVLVGSLARPVAAEPIRWEFHGNVDLASGGFPEMSALFPTGAEAHISVTIDPDMAVTCHAVLAPNCYNYNGQPPSAFTFEAVIAGHEYFLPNLTGGYSNEFIWVEPDRSAIGFDNSLSERLSGDVVGTSLAFRPHALDFSVRWPEETFASYALPQNLPTSPATGNFSLYLWTCNDAGNPDCVRRDATITGTLSSAVSVPEPGTLALMALGLGIAGIGQRARRRRNSAA